MATDFTPNGPDLPVEFCRVSGGERLTLVIDETFGGYLPHLCSPRAVLAISMRALLNLWVREGSKESRFQAMSEEMGGSASPTFLRVRKAT